MKPFMSPFIISLLTILLAGCRTTVNSSDTSPPDLRIYTHPNPSYQDDPPYTDGEPIDPSRTITIPAASSGSYEYFNVAATDEDSGISSVAITLTVDFFCRAHKESNRTEAISWETRPPAWTERTDHPDADGSETFTSSNIIARISADELWRRGNCSDGQTGTPVIPGNSLVFAVRGQYFAKACNNGSGTDEQRCSTASGRFLMPARREVGIY